MGYSSYEIELLFPNNDHNSSQICGANGESNTQRFDKISLEDYHHWNNAFIEPDKSMIYSFEN